MLPQPPTAALRKTATPYRTAGYAEEVYFNKNDVDVSFAPGQYSCQLALYGNLAKLGDNPIKIINHQIDPATPTLAICAISPAELQTLRSTSYRLLVTVTSPQGRVYVIVDGHLNPLS